MIFGPPMNGGLPMKASSLPRSMKTSGNSRGQWNGKGRPAWRRTSASFGFDSRQVVTCGFLFDVKQGVLEPLLAFVGSA